MLDLFDLPHIKNNDYYLFIDNVLGACSMITIMRKDKGPINGERGLSTAMYGYIDNPFGENPRFEYHYSLDDSLKSTFSESDIVEFYNEERSKCLKSQ